MLFGLPCVSPAFALNFSTGVDLFTTLRHGWVIGGIWSLYRSHFKEDELRPLRWTFGPPFAYMDVIAHGGILNEGEKNMATKKAAKKLSKGKKIQPTKNLSVYNRAVGR